MTDAFEVTTEQPSEVTEKETEDEDEYEIVPDTNCDDGEWVEVESTPQVRIIRLIHISDFCHD